MRKTRTWMAAATAALLATLLVLPTTPAAAGGSQPEEPSNLAALTAEHWTRDSQNEIVRLIISHVRWDRPEYRSNISCYYVRWRVAAKNGQPAGPWQPSEQGAIADKSSDYYDIDDLTVGETYDFEVRSYSESLGAYSDWVTLNKTTTLASTDSSLKSLTLSSGTLTPAFEPQKWGGVVYTATVANTVSAITLTPTANNENATITFKGAEVASGTASDAFSLATGPNYFEIAVAAEYGNWRAYNLNVIRAGPAGGLAAPTGLTLEEDAVDQKHQITMTWTLPTGATEAVLEYSKLDSTQPAPQWSTVGVTDLTTSGGKIHARLGHNIDYAVRVAGKNSSGTGAWATTTFYAHGTPGWPMNVLAVSADASLVVTWDPPVSKGAPNAVITGYAVRWRPLPDDPCCPWSEAQSQDVGDVETYTIEGLTNDQVYEVQVVASNGLGRGVWSETVRATPAQMSGSPPQEYTGGSGPSQEQAPQTQQQAPATDDTTESEPLAEPSAVRDVQAAADGRRVTVTWSAPQDGGEPDQYVVRLKTKGKGKAKIKRVDADATSVTFGKVKAGTHTVYVRAKNDAGGSKWIKTQVTVP